jgi:two-component system cell cycle sensor histidine kinase/response regulator CckA
VDLVESSAQRGAEIIKQLLTFGRGLEGERVPVQLKSLVLDMLNIIRETFPKNIVAAKETPASTWLVRGDATQLHQILMNLCVNARDAMPNGGTLTLELENQGSERGRSPA